ncbi:hypothetical protein ACFL1U_00435 [Patescibacteria group bacterium]
MPEQNSPNNEVMRAIENRIHHIEHEETDRSPEEIRCEILNFLMDEGE